MAVRISTQSLVTNILIFGCLQLSIESKSVTSCKKCLRVIDQNRPEIKEFKLNFNVTSDGVGVPVESPCRIENCGDLFADSCLQVVLEMSSTTSVHIHSCGNSSMSDERVCQLLQYGAGADVSCSVSRCGSGDCEAAEFKLEINETELVLQETQTEDEQSSGGVRLNFILSAKILVLHAVLLLSIRQ